MQIWNFLLLGCRSDIEALETMSSLITKLPVHHRCTLNYIMQHMVRMCVLQNAHNYREQPSIMIHAMCHILLRPPWEKIM